MHGESWLDHGAQVWVDDAGDDARASRVVGREPFCRRPDERERNVRPAPELFPFSGRPAPKQVGELGLLALAQLGAARERARKRLRPLIR
jgi:hypothetical protein